MRARGKGRIDKGETVTAPGVPTSYGDSVDLITDDCIKPYVSSAPAGAG